MSSQLWCVHPRASGNNGEGWWEDFLCPTRLGEGGRQLPGVSLRNQVLATEVLPLSRRGLCHSATESELGCVVAVLFSLNLGAILY